MSTHDDDTDPTGVRALLRGLPDPGPMPDDLVQRIHVSLAALPPLEDETPDAAVDPLPSRRSGTSWWTRHGAKVAVAAVVLVGGGALASGPLGLTGAMQGGSEAADTAGRSSNDEAGWQDSDSSAQGAAPESAARAGAVVVRMSGADYTRVTLEEVAGGAAKGPTTAPLTSETPTIGPIGTEIGVRSCLQALGLPRVTGAEVDLGTFDGTPAAILVVTTTTGRTAYAVARDCTLGNPALLGGPVSVP